MRNSRTSVLPDTRAWKQQERNKIQDTVEDGKRRGSDTDNNIKIKVNQFCYTFKCNKTSQPIEQTKIKKENGPHNKNYLQHIATNFSLLVQAY